MMKKVIFSLTFLVMQLFNMSAQTNDTSYLHYYNASGLDYSSQELTSLNEVSERLKSIYHDSIIQNNFKVIELSFYEFEDEMHGDDLWQIAKSRVESISRWYIFIGSQYYNNELKTTVKINLPDPLYCLSEVNLDEIELNLNYQIHGTSLSQRLPSLVEALDGLKQQLSLRFDCCVNRDDCPISFADPLSILGELYEHGYLAYPITINTTPTLRNNNEGERSMQCEIINNSTIDFNIGTINHCNIESNICAFVSNFPSAKSKFYISDNASYKETFKQVKSDFFNRNNTYDFAAHFHLYDSADKDDIPDLILYYDYSSSDIAWCEDIETFNPKNKIYTPFNFAGILPILPGDVVPEYPNLKWTDWDYYYGESYLFQTQAFANIKGIPLSDIHIYAYTSDFSLLGTLLDFASPFYSDYGGGDTYKQSILCYDDNYNGEADIPLIACYSNKDVTYHILSDYFTVDPWNNYVTTSSQGCYDDLHYSEDGKPIIDAKALEFRFGSFDEKGQPYSLSGLNSKLFRTFANKAWKKVPNKAYVSSNLGNQVYKIIVNGEIYIGRTKNALKDALFRHSEGLDKWSHLAQSQYTIEQLVLQGKTVLFDITDIKAWKGMEELMMQGYKSLGKEFASGLNKIHGRNPLKKQKYKESILAARDWLKKPIYEDVLKECQKDWGKTIDELVAEIFKKYNIQ